MLIDTRLSRNPHARHPRHVRERWVGGARRGLASRPCPGRDRVARRCVPASKDREV